MSSHLWSRDCLINVRVGVRLATSYLYISVRDIAKEDITFSSPGYRLFGKTGFIPFSGFSIMGIKNKFSIKFVYEDLSYSLSWVCGEVQRVPVFQLYGIISHFDPNIAHTMEHLHMSLYIIQISVND